MKLAVPVLLFALIRNGLAMGQYYHRARRENRKPAMTPPSRLTSRKPEPAMTPPSRLTSRNPEPAMTPPSRLTSRKPEPAMTPPSRHAVPSAHLSLQWLPCKEFVNNGGRIDRLGQIDHVSVMGEQ